MNKLIFILLSVFLLITLISCEKTNYRNAIIDSYNKEAENNKSTLLIDEIEIIDSRKVGIEYIQNLQVEDMQFVITNSQKVIELQKENILLINKNIEYHNYLSKESPNNLKEYLDKIKKDQSEIQQALIEIDTFEKLINQYKKDILNIKEVADPTIYDKEYIKIRHCIKIKLDNKTINDTIDMIFDENMNYLDHNPWIFD